MDNFDLGISGSCSGIYCFENLIDGKKYVGQAEIFVKRKMEHLYLLKNKKYNDSEIFQNAWNKYGEKNFKIWIVEECKIKLLDEREKYWIKKLYSHKTEWGYNISWGGNSPMRGRKHTPESLLKISQNHADFSGEKHPMYGKTREKSVWWGKHHSPETIQKIIANQPDCSGKNSPNFGKHHSDEHNQKISDGNKGKKMSEETKQKISNTKIGKCLSIETIQKISKSMSGKNHPMFGKHHSVETIQRMSNAQIGINHSRIIKKEIILQIKDMLNNKISVKNIYKTLNISINTIYKVKSGWYDNIYEI